MKIGTIELKDDYLSIREIGDPDLLNGYLMGLPKYKQEMLTNYYQGWVEMVNTKQIEDNQKIEKILEEASDLEGIAGFEKIPLMKK